MVHNGDCFTYNNGELYKMKLSIYGELLATEEKTSTNEIMCLLSKKHQSNNHDEGMFLDTSNY